MVAVIVDEGAVTPLMVCAITTEVWLDFETDLWALADPEMLTPIESKKITISRKRCKHGILNTIAPN